MKTCFLPTQLVACLVTMLSVSIIAADSTTYDIDGAIATEPSPQVETLLAEYFNSIWAKDKQALFSTLHRRVEKAMNPKSQFYFDTEAKRIFDSYLKRGRAYELTHYYELSDAFTSPANAIPYLYNPVRPTHLAIIEVGQSDVQSSRDSTFEPPLTLFLQLVANNEGEVSVLWSCPRENHLDRLRAKAKEQSSSER
ncbi:MAG: hypothetical protein R3C05_01340 [Pirellulaceae bacterium]